MEDRAVLKPKLSKIKISLVIILVLICIPFVLHWFILFHTYGPYTGKVVDKEIGEPLDGAVVFLRFYTNGVYGISTFVDAVETLTDSKGEFHIPPLTIFHFQLWAEWEPASVIIFKPGYGAFPMHKETLLNDEWKMELPVNKPATIKLPKLKTREERGRNIGNALSFSTAVPYEKYKLLFKAANQERVFLGGKPYSVPGEGK